MAAECCAGEKLSLPSRCGTDRNSGARTPILDQIRSCVLQHLPHEANLLSEKVLVCDKIRSRVRLGLLQAERTGGVDRRWD